MRRIPIFLAMLLIPSVVWAAGLGALKIEGAPSLKDGVIVQTVGQIVTISIAADGAKEFGISQKPGNSTFTWNQGGGTLAWLPTKADIGAYAITFKATDGMVIKTVTVKVRIEDTILK